MGNMVVDGELIKTWDCTKQIERELGYPNSNINACLNNRQKQDMDIYGGMQMSDLDKDIEILKEHIKELDEEKVLYGGFLSRKEAIENVLINLKTKEIENKDLKEKLYIQGNITEKWVKIAEKLADELSKHIWLNDKEAIIKIYREKVEEDETYS